MVEKTGEVKSKKSNIKLAELPRSPEGKVVIMNKNLAKFMGIVFSFDNILGEAERWFKNHTYNLDKNTKRERATPLGNEILVKWIATKPADRYSRYVIKLRWIFKEVNDIKVKGSDKVLQHGNVSLTIDTHIDLDYEHQWGGSKFQNFLKHLYERYIYERTLLRHKLQLLTESNVLYSLIKKETSRYS